MNTEHRVVNERQGKPSLASAQGGGTAALSLLAFAQLIVAIDFNIVYVALPDIGRSLGFSPQGLQWVISAYGIGFGGFLLIGGRLADRYGARRLFLVGLGLFAGGCAVGGAAWDPVSLVVARGVQGLGAALLTPAMLALIFINFAEGAPRTRALGAWGAAGSGGLAAGALLGGVLTDYLSWRAVLWVLVPLALIALLSTPRVIPADPPPLDRRAALDALNALSAALATAAVALVLAGVVEGPTLGWSSPGTLVLLIVGAALAAAFGVRQRRGPNPLIPRGLVQRGGLAVVVAVIALFQTALLGAYYVFTTYLQDDRGYEPLAAGLAFLPLTLVSMAASLRATGPIIDRIGVRGALAASLSVNAVGLLAVAAAMSAGGTFWVLLPGIVLWGLGGGVAFPTVFIAAGQGLAPEQEGAAAATATTAQQLGGALGLAGIVAIAAHGAAGIAELRWAGAATAALSLLGGAITVALLGRTRPESTR